jgi:2-amino-4-hydroxy-6-hydroxymethyldihydropteridine diphosphokinase
VNKLNNASKITSPSALITGGSSRLGGKIAMHLADQGWNLVIHYSAGEKEALRIQKQIALKGRECHLIPADFMVMTDPGDVVRQAKSIFPTLNLLINNASVYESSSLLDTTVELFDRQFCVNLRAPLFLSKAFAKDHNGLIINIIDNKVHLNSWEYGAYILSKKSLSDLTVLSALEFAPQVRVNGIAPGIVLPVSSRTSDYMNWRKLGVPLGKIVSTDQIMLTIDFILKNELLNGQILTVDGGESIQCPGRYFENYYGQFSPIQHIAVLSVGSNIEPEVHISTAREILIENQHFLGESPCYLTKPVGLQAQPDFQNTAFVVRTGLSKDEFKKYLNGVEKRLGRVKGPDKTGPHTIDLDIVIWDGEVVCSDYFHQEYISKPVNDVKHLWKSS